MVSPLSGTSELAIRLNLGFCAHPAAAPPDTAAYSCTLITPSDPAACHHRRPSVISMCSRRLSIDTQEDSLLSARRVYDSARLCLTLEHLNM
jgi:hypothetical protein